MAERRMFAKTIIDSDAFLDMPLSTQALYFHFVMRADDEGFVNNPKKIMRMVGASDDEMKVLITKRFLIPFESGVVVVKHWFIHNYIRSDRLQETKYQEERKRLSIKENGSYTENGMSDECLTDGGQVPDKCQHRLKEDSIGKDSIGEDKDTRHKYGEYKNVLLSDTDLEKLKAEFSDWEERIEKLSTGIASKGYVYKNHLATIRNWARKDKTRGKKVSFQNYDQGEEQIYTGPDLLKEAREARG